jgi:hypothetical protein
VDLKQIADFIQSTGFPIFVAIILLYRVDSMHTANLNSIHENTLELRQLRTEISNRREVTPLKAA